MTKFYGTFGSGHTFQDRSVAINAHTESDARYAMHHTFGVKWCTVYAEDYKDSEFFQPPVFLLSVVPSHDPERPTVKCIGMNLTGV